MALLFQPDSSDNWIPVFSDHRFAQSGVINGRRYDYSIPWFEVPILLESPILAIRCSSDNAGIQWQKAGYAFRLQKPTSIIPQLNTLTYESEFLPLGRTKLIDYSGKPRVEVYALEIRPAVWLQDLRYTLWEYRGPYTDSVEQKIDQILETLN